MARPDPPTLAGSKRKLQDNSLARKRSKTRHKTADALPWKVVTRPVEAGMGGDDGILELEEVDDVEVVYEETEGGRVVTFNVVSSEPSAEVPQSQSAADDDSDGSPPPDDVVHEPEPFDSVNLLPNWHSYSLHPQLLRVLHSKGFLSPTPIQSAAIPFAMSDRDVVGVAQTGSGKTLAYGLPILHRLLSCAKPSSKTKRQLGALILAPTRELALQVSSHLNACLNAVEVDEGKNKNKAEQTATRSPPLVSVAAIVGGMSSQKQRRILDRGVDVLVATPGRLWDIMEDDDSLSKQVKNLKFLVLDEADRMIEAGHFAELENILRLTLRESKADQIEPDAEEDDREPVRDGLQTFVFSATLSKDLQRNVKRRSRPKTAGKYNKRDKPASTLDDLLLRLDFRDPEPEIIDLSPQGGVVSTLKESKIECLSADKDVYLYYFLLRYPGRSLVFLSSIDGIRRLMPLTELLNIKAFPLHSQLEQRQRLKNLDRFKSTPNSVLLATDIAARGLDIPAVDHVIHYQIPRSADAYVHRNGRTARAMRKGFSMLMCSPDERRVVRALLGSLGRQESEIAEMSIELNMLDKLKERVQLARQIETTHHKIKKANHDRKWMKETAEALEVELDSDFVSDSDEDKPSNQKRKAKDLKNANLKAELKRLLAQPLIARGVSTRYITSGSRPIVDDILAGEFNETMVGIKKTEAGNDLVVGKKKKLKVVVKEPKEEEWRGIEAS
ncbi:P-loop containing nucleoside triphosphate hydrolase protein [Mycena capillaripes]|nr:P-loop containing nucleoside triphosphate hydrolase protein [Mycena capillaripes]